MEISDWSGLYGEGWQREIVPEAFCHPAKFSRALIRHIYDHCAAEGWLAEGDTVIDPFGGVALGGLDAMRLGAHWVGVELEAKFIALGEQNIALWNSRYTGRFARWGTARLMQGDSRHLLDVVQEAGMCVSSPPFGDGLAPGRRPGDKLVFGNARYGHKDNVTEGYSNYGSTPGNLGNLRADEKGFAAVVGSPPYEESMDSKTNGIDWTKTKKDYPGRVMHAERIAIAERHHTERRYGETKGQLGSDTGDTFWSAAREIVAQTYAALCPGGHACWVVKAFVRNKAIVDFPSQWRQLCESVGFHTLHEHHALLTEDRGTQYALDGNHKRSVTERKSFFRRLAEKKGSPRIDYEVVLCMVK